MLQILVEIMQIWVCLFNFTFESALLSQHQSSCFHDQPSVTWTQIVHFEYIAFNWKNCLGLIFYRRSCANLC